MQLMVGRRAEPDRRAPGNVRAAARSRDARYQAWVAWQCGQATVVDTGARKTKPQAHA
jgi:hypothetical protein